MSPDRQAAPRFSYTLLTLALAVQSLCVIPFYCHYSWSDMQPWFTPQHATLLEKNFFAAIAAQLDLAKTFSILTALLVVLYLSLFSQQAKEKTPDRSGLLKFGAVAVVFGLVAQVLVMSRCLQLPMTLDDPYIDFRYVQNWLKGMFDYNPGLRIQGYSSPLHLAVVYVATKTAQLLPSLTAGGLHPAAISQNINIFLQICNLILVFAVAERGLKSRVFAIVAATVYTCGASSTLAAIDNKESALMQFLILLSLLAAVTARYQKWCPYTAMALSLTRPEGIIWTVREVLSDVIDGGVATIKRWLPTIVVIGAWYAFACSYYGTVIPHGAMGRANMFHSSPTLTVHACPFILTTLGIDTFKHLFIYWPTSSDFFAPIFTFEQLAKGMVAFILLVAYAHRHEWLRSYAYNAIAIFAFFAAFDPWMFSWYYSWFTLIAVLILPLMAQTACAVIMSAKSALAKKSGNVIFSWLKLGWGAALLLLVILPQLLDINLINWFSAPEGKRESIKHYMRARVSEVLFVANPAIERLSLYKEAAAFIAARSGAQGTLATWEPGVLGYYLPQTKVLDLGGLVSDEALEYYPVPVNDRTRKDVWGSIPARAVIALKPDRVILFDSFGNNGMLKNRAFLESYRLVKFWPMKLWDGEGLLLFERNDKNGTK